MTAPRSYGLWKDPSQPTLTKAGPAPCGHHRPGISPATPSPAIHPCRRDPLPGRSGAGPSPKDCSASFLSQRELRSPLLFPLLPNQGERAPTQQTQLRPQGEKDAGGLPWKEQSQLPMEKPCYSHASHGRQAGGRALAAGPLLPPAPPPPPPFPIDSGRRQEH